jgi:hypothetical protein
MHTSREFSSSHKHSRENFFLIFFSLEITRRFSIILVLVSTTRVHHWWRTSCNCKQVRYICHLTAGFILRSRVLSRLVGTSLKTGGSRRGPDPLAIQSGIYVSTMERSFIKLVHCLLFYRADWIKVRKQHNLNRRATRPVTRVSLPRDSLTATVPRHSHG